MFISNKDQRKLSSLKKYVDPSSNDYTKKTSSSIDNKSTLADIKENIVGDIKQELKNQRKYVTIDKHKPVRVRSQSFRNLKDPKDSRELKERNSNTSRNNSKSNLQIPLVFSFEKDLTEKEGPKVHRPIKTNSAKNINVNVNDKEIVKKERGALSNDSRKKNEQVYVKVTKKNSDKYDIPIDQLDCEKQYSDKVMQSPRFDISNYKNYDNNLDEFLTYNEDYQIYSYDVPLAVIERADGFQGLNDSLIDDFNFWLNLPAHVINNHARLRIKHDDKPKLNYFSSDKYNMRSITSEHDLYKTKGSFKEATGQVQINPTATASPRTGTGKILNLYHNMYDKKDNARTTSPYTKNVEEYLQEMKETNKNKAQTNRILSPLRIISPSRDRNAEKDNYHSRKFVNIEGNLKKNLNGQMKRTTSARNLELKARVFGATSNNYFKSEEKMDNMFLKNNVQCRVSIGEERKNYPTLIGSMVDVGRKTTVAMYGGHMNQNMNLNGNGGGGQVKRQSSEDYLKLNRIENRIKKISTTLRNRKY